MFGVLGLELNLRLRVGECCIDKIRGIPEHFLLLNEIAINNSPWRGGGG